MSFLKWEFCGLYFGEVLTVGVEFGIVEVVVETGAALAGRVFIWAY
jgi:hypothetical protein